MSEAASAGRLSLDVEADIRGLRRKLDTKLKAELAQTKAKVRAEIDARGLKAGIRAAVKDAQSAAVVKVRAELDARGLKAQVRAAVKDAGGAAVRVGTSLDARSLRGQVREAVKAAQADARITARMDVDARKGGLDVPVDADTAPLEEEIDRARKRQESRPIRVPVTVDKATARELMSAGRAATLLVGGLDLVASAGTAVVQLVGGVGQLAAGLFSVTSAAAAAAPAVALIPAGVVAAVQSVGTLLAGFSGLGDAVSALGKQDLRSAADARTAARAREAAARRVADAQRAVADAQENVALTAEQGAQSIVDAERRVGDAQQSTRQAQEALNRARVDARERLEDLRLSLQGAALDEKAAQLAIDRAREQKTRAHGDPRTSALDKREADLAYEQAVQRMQEVRESNADLRREAADAARKGVKNADVVVAASAGVAQAKRDELDAEQELGGARRDAARASQQSARAVLDAQRGLLEAQQAQADAMTKTATAATTAQVAMDNLSPAGQRFARFLRGTVLPALQELRVAAQEALLPRAQRATSSLLTLVRPVSTVVAETGRVLGDLMVRASEVLTTPLWRRDLVGIGRNNARALGLFGSAALNLLDPLRDVLSVVGRPGGLVDRFATWTEQLTAGVRATVAARRSNGQLARTLDHAGDTISQWYRIVRNILTGIRNIGREANPAGQTLTDSFEGATVDFVGWTRRSREPIRAFFATLVPVVESFGRALVGVSSLLGRVMADPATVRLMKSVEKTLVPAFERLVGVLSKQDTGVQLSGIIADVADSITNLVDSGVLGQFTSALGFMARALKQITANPVGTTVIGGILAVAGVAGPLALVAGAFLRIEKSLRKISRFPGVGKALGLGGLGKAALNKVGKGGVAGAVGGLAAGAVGGLIARGQATGSGRSIGGGAVAGAGTGAGIGALAGSVVPVIGTGVGAAIGGAVGGVAGAAKGAGGLGPLFAYLRKQFAAGGDSLVKAAKQYGPRIVGAIGDFARTAPGAAFGWVVDHADDAARIAVRGLAQIPHLALRAMIAGVRGGAYLFAWVLDSAGTAITGVAAAFTAAGPRLLAAVWGAITNPGETARNVAVWLTQVSASLSALPVRLLSAAKALGGSVLHGIGQGVRDSSPQLGKDLNDLSVTVRTAMGTIGRSISRAWSGVRSATTRTFTSLGVSVLNFFAGLPARIAGAFRATRTWFATRWAEVGRDVAVKVSGMRQRVVSFVANLPANLAVGFRSLLAYWSLQWAAIRRLPGQVMATIGRNVTTGLANVQRAFSTGVTAIGLAWDKLRAAARTPVKWVAEHVLNPGIINPYRRLGSLFGIGGDRLPSPIKVSQWADGGIPKGKDLNVYPGYTPGRDTGVIAVGGGEAIMRPEWTKAIGPKAVAAQNRAARTGGVGGVRRLLGRAGGGFLGAFRQGGVVDPAGGSATAPAHHPVGGRTALRAFGRLLESMGFKVSENPAFGGVTAGAHVRGSTHYTGDAIDVNKYPGTSVREQTAIDRIMPLVRQYGLRSLWRVLNHFGHLHVDTGTGASRGPKGLVGRAAGFLRGLNPLDWMKGQVTSRVAGIREHLGRGPFPELLGGMANKLGAAALSRMTGVASKVGDIASTARDRVAEFLNPAGPSGGVRSRLQRVAATRGWGGGPQWAALDSLVRTESGYRPDAQNPTSTAYGLFQFLDSTWKAMGVRKTGDPRIQIAAGLKYVASRYGDPLKAWAFHQAHGYYSGGGVVPALAAGATVRPQPGGTVVRVAERGRAETVVDTGLMNRRMKDLEALQRLLRDKGTNSREPLIGELTLNVGSGATVDEGLGSVMWWLRQHDRGGVFK